MFSDIVIPKNNEAEFIQIASRLSIKKLIFLYELDEFNEEKLQKKMQSIDNKKINVEIGIIANQKNLNKAAKLSKLLFVKSSDKDRFFIESKKIKIIYGFEETFKKDYLHHRASGLNQTIGEMGRKYDVHFGFSYGSLLNNTNQITSVILGRMMQNIRICQKYKVKTVIGSFSDKPYGMRAQHDVISLFSILGMDGKNTKNSLDYDL